MDDMQLTRKEVEEMRRRRGAAAEKSKKTGMRRTFVNIAKDVFTKRSEAERKAERGKSLAKGGSMAFKMLMICLLLTGAATALSMTFLKDTPDVAIIVDSGISESEEARKAAEAILHSFKGDRKDFERLAGRLDGHGMTECKKILETMKDMPAFDSAQVISPKLDPSILCVVPHMKDGKPVQFMFRRLGEDRLVFEGLWLDSD